ncbi:MAG: hypothetical protein PHE67_03715 [Campylobacterales bacterium]|nr:hypothetical protein [Campylobacterales bacterium]
MKNMNLDEKTKQILGSKHNIDSILAMDRNSTLFNELGDEIFMRLYFLVYKSIIENDDGIGRAHLFFFTIDKNQFLEFFIDSESRLITYSLNGIHLKTPMAIQKEHFYTILAGRVEDIPCNIHGLLHR